MWLKFIHKITANRLIPMDAQSVWSNSHNVLDFFYYTIHYHSRCTMCSSSLGWKRRPLACDRRALVEWKPNNTLGGWRVTVGNMDFHFVVSFQFRPLWLKCVPAVGNVCEICRYRDRTRTAARPVARHFALGLNKSLRRCWSLWLLSHRWSDNHIVKT